MPKESPNAFFASIMSGIKSTLEWKHPSGAVAVNLEHDGGATSSPRGRAAFHVVELTGRVTSPAASSLFYLAQPLKGLISNLKPRKPEIAPPPADVFAGGVSEAVVDNFTPFLDNSQEDGQFVASTQKRIKL